MKNTWLAALLCVVFAFAVAGCSAPGGTARKGRRSTGVTQTGTNIPRWTSDAAATRKSRTAQRKARAKREKKVRAEKPKREREERRRPAADEEVITRGGFR